MFPPLGWKKLRTENPQVPQQIGPLAYCQGEGAAPQVAPRRQFLGTWSHTDLPDLAKPKDTTKEEFGNLLFRSARKVFAFGQAQRGTARANVLLKGSVVDEVHQNGEVHKHFGILADKAFTPHALESHLQSKHRIRVHFSMTHDYYWTTFVYMTVPGDGPNGKPLESLDPEPWLSPGHPPVNDELLDMPRGARKSDKLRVRNFLGAAPEGGRGRAEDAELSFEDFSAALVDKGLRTRGAALAWLGRNKSLPAQEDPAAEDHSEAAEELRGANDAARQKMDEAKKLGAFVHKHVRDLNDRIALAWEIEDAVSQEERAALSAWDIVGAAAAAVPCVCKGQWMGLTEQMLGIQVAEGREQKVAPDELPHSEVVRAALRKALENGCAKHQNVFFIGPPNAAKTHVVAPLVTIFGKESFRRPLGKTNYPMMAIHGKKVCVLEDLRASTFGLGWDAYLVWWEGQPLPVPMPQNHHKGPLDYTDRAPVFATGGGKLRIPLREALELGLDPNVQNDMMDKRWVYFQFTKSFDGDQRRAVKPCGRCFAQWVISGVPAPSAVPAPAASSAAVPSAAATAAPLSPTPPASSGAAPIPAATSTRAGPDPFPQVEGLWDLFLRAKLPGALAADLGRDAVNLGPRHVEELAVDDWQRLPSWSRLRVMETRRFLALVSRAS